MVETKEIIIDAEHCVLGRIASYAAKKALQGNKIIIVNSEKAIIVGKKKDILNRYHDKFSLGGTSQKGPFFSRISENIMRRTIRGMLPWKRTRGREAYKRIFCYKGVPTEYKDKPKEIISKSDAINYLTLQQLCKAIGKER